MESIKENVMSLRPLVSEDSDFLTEFAVSKSLPKIETTRIDGVEIWSTGGLTLWSKDLSDRKIFPD